MGLKGKQVNDNSITQSKLNITTESITNQYYYMLNGLSL